MISTWTSRDVLMVVCSLPCRIIPEIVARIGEVASIGCIETATYQLLVTLPLSSKAHLHGIPDVRRY